MFFPTRKSFESGQVRYQQPMEGHEVHLLTLTHGEATKQRFELGYSKPEMGAIRCEEMQNVKKVLQLASLTVLNYSDNGLAELDPRKIENTIEGYIHQLKQDVLVTYPVYGVSGFNDHLVMHAVIKRLFVGLKDQGWPYPRRLAFLTIKEVNKENSPFNLKASSPKLIDCEVSVQEEARKKNE